MDASPETVTIGEAARLLGVHRNTVRNRINAGRYKAHKVVTPQGETYVIERTSLYSDVHNIPDNPSQQSVHDNPSQDAQTAQLTTSDQQDAVVRLVQQMLAPFVQELGAAKQELGRVSAERDHLQARVAELEARTTPAAVFAEVAAAPLRRVTPADAELRVEQDALRARVAALEAEQVAAAHVAPDVPRQVQKRAWWRFWEVS